VPDLNAVHQGGVTMPTMTDAVKWLKKNFGAQIDAAVAGTPFSRDLIVAIAMQETSYIWQKLIDTKRPAEILALCVGDTIDGRSAFPKSRAALEKAPKGKEMFKVARDALEGVAEINKDYANAFKKPNKFCHGFGMFQYDIQFFKEDPNYFLDKKWATFDGTVGKCVSELKTKLKKVYGSKKTTLTHDESVYVAIAYNKGSADRSKGFKQGFKDSDGKFYGEGINKFMTLSEKT
jgi:hypothetical protein